jgi:hypothetical protein
MGMKSKRVWKGAGTTAGSSVVAESGKSRVDTGGGVEIADSTVPLTWAIGAPKLSVWNNERKAMRKMKCENGLGRGK